MKPQSWRDIARPIIARVLTENNGADDITIRKALHDVYPFGERQYHPYKVWLDEIKKQRGKPKRQKRKQVEEESNYKQLELFQE
jgi:hypothetical protein